MKIVKAFYNMDYISVDIKYDDGSLLRILREAVEINLRLTMESQSRLIWLAETEPLTYVQLALDGTMQEYVDIIDRRRTTEANTIRQQYRQQHPEMTEAQIDSIIREIQMYDS